VVRYDELRVMLKPNHHWNQRLLPVRDSVLAVIDRGAMLIGMDEYEYNRDYLPLLAWFGHRTDRLVVLRTPDGILGFRFEEPPGYDARIPDMRISAAFYDAGSSEPSELAKAYVAPACSDSYDPAWRIDHWNGGAWLSSLLGRRVVSPATTVRYKSPTGALLSIEHVSDHGSRLNLSLQRRNGYHYTEPGFEVRVSCEEYPQEGSTIFRRGPRGDTFFYHTDPVRCPDARNRYYMRYTHSVLDKFYSDQP
jgi:hypothetical protein